MFKQVGVKRFFTTAVTALATFGLTATFAGGAFAQGAVAGQQWTVVVGGAAGNQSYQAMGFFPHVITVDAGDTVHFDFTGMHTVSFPDANGKLAAPGDFAPAGGHTYDGSTYISSGMGHRGEVYPVTFTKPGVYPYYCEMHPGMAGVVIVQAEGANYPMTQAQYTALATQESGADIAAAEHAAAGMKSMMMSKAGPHGTRVWSMFMDVPEPTSYTLQLGAVGASGVHGTATLSMTKPGTWSVALTLAGLTAGAQYTPALDLGEIGSGVTVPGSQFSSFSASASGTATVSGTVHALAIPTGVWFVTVNDASSQAVAGGTVNYASYSYERFDMPTMHIRVGDTIVWTQMGPNEMHTVTFLPKGWKDVPNESMMPRPAGGHVYRGVGFFNSGFLAPGQSYELTFAKAGDFQYRCLLHDVIGMYGRVDVAK